jgi:sterol desaturase/sphingolipid hydroxylase (fatty acid hydroxylase superfamily)/ferredoxin
MNVTPFFENFIDAYIEQLSWYSAFAFPFFIIFWIVGKKYFKKIRIQETERAKLQHFKHDLGFSVVTFFVFAIMDVFILYLESKGYTQVYFDISKYCYLWLGLSFFIVLFLDDMFFYWSHRAMHMPRFYKIFHKVHHESTDPSPLTAFAFHPTEAVVEYFIGFVLPFLLPLNFGVLITWQIFSMLNNVLGHLGYEVYPKGWVKFPLLKFKTASTHHNMHHQLFNGNYALYFTWWDKWMGTEFKDYETRHEQIFERKNSKKSNQAFHSLSFSERELFLIKEQTSENASQKAQVSAQVFGQSYEFETEEGKTILQSALNQNIPLPFSCKNGLCGMCKMKCIEGNVKMLNNQVLSESDINDGFILTCQSLAQTEKISIQNA